MSSASGHSGRSAAVTGAVGGLGRDIALGLAAKGYVVIGTAVSPAEVEDLKKVSGRACQPGRLRHHQRAGRVGRRSV
jgi:NAD(P)-dependent dehydrogenase (short-subunit alcohol dehydrogenase family)